MENVPVVENRTPILRGAAGTTAGAAGSTDALPVDGGGLFRVQVVKDNMIHTAARRQSRFFILTILIFYFTIFPVFWVVHLPYLWYNKSMPKIPGFIQKSRRSLYIQMLFIMLAFFVMIILSYVFSHNIVRAHLIDNTENVLTFGQAKLEADLRGPRITLDFISEAVRDMIMEGGGIDELQDYFNKLAGYARDEYESNHGSNFNGFYGYFETIQDEPVFIDSLHRTLPDNFSPRTRPWYQAAVLAGNRIAVTYPYLNPDTGEISFAYTRRIYDDAGLPLGIVCLDVRINDTLEYIVETALAQRGYGLLLSQDLTVIAHPNREFVGLNASNPRLSFSKFINELRDGQDISEQQIISYLGEPSIVFFRRLPNGFYIGLATPKGPYYQSVRTMTGVLTAFGILLAAGLIFILTKMIGIEAAKEKANLESIHKSAFLANMSHEIRTPMNAIIGMTAIGISSVDPGRMVYCLRKIDDASKHLLGIISDILDMSKIEANKFELSLAEFDFDKMIQRIINVVNFRLDEKRQKLEIDIDVAIPRLLFGDDQRLAQVITNLLGNAIKFTPEQGSISLMARLWDEKDSVCTILFIVKDTGIGISAEQQKKLFQSFQQADTDTTRKYGGTGLGLAISKNIVEMMCGSIWVESEIGKGSAFSFTVNLKRIENKIEASGIEPQKTEEPSPDITGIFAERRILLAEDMEINREIVMALLESTNIAIDYAENGEEAVGIFSKNPEKYDLILMDLQMPKMDGFEATRLIRAFETQLENNAPTQVPIVAMTANVFREDIDKCLKAGMNDHLGKPLNFDEVLEKLKRYMPLK
jgi:signal transduction histidine kinase/CheY-like chemotaxis protein